MRGDAEEDERLNMGHRAREQGGLMAEMVMEQPAGLKAR